MNLACKHDGRASEIQLCPHLVGQKDAAFWRVLRGAAMRYDCCCATCEEAFAGGKSLSFVEVCSACAREIDGERWEMRGWLGSPTIREHPVPFDETLRKIIFAAAMSEANALHPLDSMRVLASIRGEIGVFEDGDFSSLTPVPMPDDTEKNWCRHPLTRRFHVSPGGRFAALVNDFGRYGAVFDLDDNRQTMNLDRGEYLPQTQYFPCAFFANGERDLIIHATSWNRLEISDPRTGALLTARGPMNYGDENPHYLDYFHGALRVSPDSQWIVGDGWIWHPLGVVRSWNLGRWLESNAYESEDGPSKRDLCYRDSFWSGPICWLDAHRLAVEGIGTDEEKTRWHKSKGTL